MKIKRAEYEALVRENERLREEIWHLNFRLHQERDQVRMWRDWCNEYADQVEELQEEINSYLD